MEIIDKSSTRKRKLTSNFLPKFTYWTDPKPLFAHALDRKFGLSQNSDLQTAYNSLQAGDIRTARATIGKIEAQQDLIFSQAVQDSSY